ncbi:transmembrane protein, putative (macronuclear) [Tetrahymena thermophila SB210]|uniref:Transmembrane protein, putative n=1 Tax=Tetrahymena thermophila (strain SB210) TaxID=312017 RepID=A4VEM0_TETTS|nr:transmembrane protein, putative [Tetrahymena thermophila SB210]EDK31978.2 transmembrane protein, putative [Tetrahymena thermophila SB210]|eukprot:XP_001471161.2 transmembrane protein, putative [Tetrahymena thermophila SB210]
MEKLDYFGRDIQIRFKGLKSHRTKCGTLLTFILIALILIRICYWLNDFITGNNPSFLYQERQVKSPKRFQITPETFSLIFGVLDVNNNYVFDPEIVTVESVLELKTTTFNETTQSYQDNWSTTLIPLEICTQDLIVSDPVLQSEFSYLSSHYCFPKNFTLFIEGEYHSDSFAQIYFYIKRCRGSNCKSDSILDNFFSHFYGEVIFTDVYVSPENKKNPFTKYVRDNFWEAGYNFPQKVFMEMRNNYIESDFGFFTSNVQTDIYPSYSQMYQMMTSLTDDIYSTFVFRFEKKKENLYKRSYKNFLSTVSDLGGLLQVLTTVGILSSFFFTQTHLNQELINNTFTFKECKNKQETKSNQRQSIYKDQKKKSVCSSISKNTQSQNSKIQSTNQTLNVPRQRSLSNNSSIQNFKSRFRSSDKENSSEKLEALDSPSKRIRQIISYHLQLQKNAEMNVKQKEGSHNKNEKIGNKKNIDQKKQNPTILLEETINKDSNSMKFNIFQYLKSLCLRYGDLQRKRVIYDYSIKQLYHYIDIQLIINKLIEFDKLKRIVLDDDQLLLFEYLPKPSILYSFKGNSVEFHDNQSFTISKKSKNELDNIQKAIQSFKNLLNKPFKHQKDVRILKYLDLTYKQIFEEESQQSQISQDRPQEKKSMEEEIDNQIKNSQQQQDFDEINQDFFVEDNQNESNIEENLKFYNSAYKQSPQMIHSVLKQQNLNNFSLDIRTDNNQY